MILITDTPEPEEHAIGAKAVIMSLLHGDGEVGEVIIHGGGKSDLFVTQLHDTAELTLQRFIYPSPSAMHPLAIGIHALVDDLVAAPPPALGGQASNSLVEHLLLGHPTNPKQHIFPSVARSRKLSIGPSPLSLLLSTVTFFTDPPFVLSSAT
jgi:hypothetical protein